MRRGDVPYAGRRPRDDLGHQFVGMQAALHQRIGIAVLTSVTAIAAASWLCLTLTMRKLRMSNPFSSASERILLSGPIRIGSIRPASAASSDPFSDSTSGVGHCHVDRRHAVRPRDQLLVAAMLVRDQHLRQHDALALIFSSGGERLDGALDDQDAFLVRATAVEQHMMVVIELLPDRDGDRDRVTDRDRAHEAHRLVDKDGAGPGTGCRVPWKSARRTHAVRDDLAEDAAVRELLIDDRWIDVAGRDGSWMSSGRSVRTNGRCRRP